MNENVEPAKTLWDWLDLLIVSAVLAVWGSGSRGRDEYFQSQRAEDDALEKYLDYVSKLAELYGAEGITKEELEQQAKTLEGATMPDGTRHD